ncbi:similar to Saccharomyces cerevisiae YBL090W MRP21 Mitochondrial ribosomal protein of the small subunit [Maudiozyma barnettii]|uniref:Similar to Saccharomyces cerevisiae YBL090W MRP21 Mitochondrial ribosomal protein of the small subunit n=1 Tax=Maudiozyma barnettii TaxID=61262 RepID=A0A8H2VBF0_9SACH|nr:mitochondrial 37S ribosomal protein MRP21 [Kazachstania barnettii]CAB4252149.1 similar to Saccharomyces cerevisiae YBL090W MRP21 Mitochondrial ribosomal protein of the small subunit [Kazachstania barnettii]CAD1778715.1 similar to Saccharomyces cerevisiae YBL090W MRP21 Mitochondrial ribosomal protein of the small subunit [Kazachstania barnettii]
MLRSIGGFITQTNRSIVTMTARSFVSFAKAQQIQYPFNNNNAQDILRSFPNDQKNKSDVGLNISFNAMKQANTTNNLDRDSSIILPEQIREEAASLKNFSIKTGRTVLVNNSDTASACRRLNGLVFANQIAIDRRKQRFHMKPGKKAEMKRSQRHRKDFMKGFKRLMEVVKDAKRKGY